ncbi:MAG: hypothetical protein E6K19_05995 [Methanobacteriota archaeon]|nr:MAG: hypothetical protein E6K19_05995 [Euryarchaeota archaeon]
MPRREEFEMAGVGEGATSRRQRPFAVWVIAGGLVYIALALLVYTLPLLAAIGLGFLVLLTVFIVLLLVAAGFTLREKRWAFVMGSVTGIVLASLFSLNIVTSASNPADSGFWFTMSALPVLFLIVLFSILGFRNAKAGLMQKRYLATPASSGGLVVVAVVGFVVGSLVVGMIGAGIILRNSTAVTADVEIVSNAAAVSVPYSPQSFHVVVGGTVSWVNRDTVAHSVTSALNSTYRFDSGLFTTGALRSHSFPEAGTFYYYCTLHTQMLGVIVVG